MEANIYNATYRNNKWVKYICAIQMTVVFDLLKTQNSAETFT